MQEPLYGYFQFPLRPLKFSMWPVHKLALENLCYTLTLSGHFTFSEEIEWCLVMQNLLPQCQVEREREREREREIERCDPLNPT